MGELAVSNNEARLELFKDSGVIYGLGINGDYTTSQAGSIAPIIIKPEYKESGFKHRPIGFQKILNRPPMNKTHEFEIANELHKILRIRGGIGIYIEPSEFRENTQYRKKFFAYKRSALVITNALIGQLLDVIPENILKVVRRFPFKQREAMYMAFVQDGRNAIQLSYTFPALAMVIYGELIPDKVNKDEWKEKLQEARLAVKQGEKLKYVADIVEMPMYLRQFKPAIVRNALIYGDSYSERLIYDNLPETTPAQRRWITALKQAGEGGPDFKEWVAKHPESFGKRIEEVEASIENLVDWVRASTIASLTPQQKTVITPRDIFEDDQVNGDQFITRQFNKYMSLHTVLRLSDEWHEAVIESIAPSKNMKFPEPWYEGEDVEGLKIIPITNGAELYREGKTMKHCVVTHADSVIYHNSYIYSVRLSDGKSIATFELCYDDDKKQIKLEQMRGKCNALVPKEIKKVINKWFNKNKKLYGNGHRIEGQTDQHACFPNDHWLNDLPF